MLGNFRRKRERAAASRTLGLAVLRMSDASSSKNSADARPSTEAMVKAAEQLLQLFPSTSPEADGLRRMVAAGREMLVSIGVDRRRLNAADVVLHEAVNDPAILPLLARAL